MKGTMQGFSRHGGARSGLRRRHAGFGLLETIAALTILASGAIILFTWIVQTQTQLQKIEQQALKDTAKLEAIAFLSTLNPSALPQGSQVLGRLNVQWRATLTQPMRNTLNVAGRPDIFDVGLYAVRVQVSRPGESEWFEFEQLLVGSKQVKVYDPAGGFR
jgi:type II secretory pathway component PulJ